MPPKRRADKARSATKQPLPPPPPPPPLPPPELDAAKVRKEWSKFTDTWYEPQKRKLVDKLQKDLLAKYKALGPPKDTQKQREMELFEKLDAIALQLAKPARAEWERRLDLAQLREDQWDDMSAEEQHAVMSVFVGFFADVEDMDDDISPGLSSIEQDESVVQDPPHRFIPPTAAKQPVPPTPTRQTFEFVNPTSFFADNMTPPNPSKSLPALSMDHLATLGPSNSGRSADPVSAGLHPSFGFHTWASEAGIVTQQPQPPPPKPPPASTSAQSLSARPRATDNISRQPSAASILSSPPMRLASPQYSPPDTTTKFSPQVNTDNLPLGKRYIGPIILEEDPDPMDEDLLKSKMAEEYQQYKISLRIQMIYQFHAEAAEVEIKLFETLLTDEGTKESRARAVQEHETSMMRLREQKEEERKRLCGEERERRRQAIRQHLAQRRSIQNRDPDPVGPKTNPPKPVPDKSSSQPRPGKATHQKENVPVAQPAASSSKLEPPSILKKSNSMLSQDEASANETLFANAKAMMAQGKASTTILTPAQASLNEALFSNAAAMLATQGPSAKSTVPLPSIMKKSNSTRLQEFDVPQITVSFADPASTPAPESPAQVTLPVKAKKGKRVQLPPSQPVTITEELDMDMDAEPPPLAPSLWDAATVATKNVWDPFSTFTASTAEEARADPEPVPAPSSKGTTSANGKGVAKKGKRAVTIAEEPDVDADPIVVTPVPSVKPAKPTKGAWGAVNTKSKLFAPPEESDAEPPPAQRGNKGKNAANAGKSAPGQHQHQKPQLKVAITEVPESEGEPSPAPAPMWTTAKDKARDKAKFVWDVPAVTPKGTQAGSKVPQPQQTVQEPRRGAPNAWSQSVRMDILDPEDAWLETTTVATGGGESSTKTSVSASPMPGSLASPALEETEEDEDEVDASAWFNPENMSYWANLIAGPPGAEDRERGTLGVPSRLAAGTTTSTTTSGELEPTGRHVRWTPTVSGESDDEEGFGEADEELATSMWMQYAISGGDVPAPGGTTPNSEDPAAHLTPLERTNSSSNGGGSPLSVDAGVWEQGRSKKKMPSTGGGEAGNRVQLTTPSGFDRAALAGPWPKMESWLSPPSRGQNSGSTRVF